MSLCDAGRRPDAYFDEPAAMTIVLFCTRQRFLRRLQVENQKRTRRVQTYKYTREHATQRVVQKIKIQVLTNWKNGLFVPCF